MANQITNVGPDYYEVKAQIEEFNKTQDNALGLPTGFHKVKSRSGEEVGYGFYCPTCKLHFPIMRKPQDIKHCGKVTLFPTGLFSFLKTMGLKSYTIQRRYF
jgi:hypothetical protein